ncbi:aminodeoxychorismate synthase component I [Aurantimonas sp. A2-1-M11]|uniref:aminodeoxychorismate synthase component I n=1 Tax=Aurantimonas sp. A2-1-M11 TaxID=3113712 RepID=UPI002F933FCC
MVYDEIAPLAPEIAAARLRPLGGLAYLDSAMRHETLGRYSYVAAAPFAAFTVDGEGAMLDDRRLEGAPLAALDAVLAQHRQPTVPGLPPFQGGAVGFIGYEFARHLERLTAPADLDPAQPSLRFDLYDTVLACDLAEDRAFLIGARRAGETDDGSARARIARFRAALEREAPPPGIGARPGGLDWRSNFFADDYRAAIQRVRDYILAGDIYQANVAQTFRAALPDDFDPFGLYLRLRRTNAAPFGAYLEHDGLAIASSSPERFLKRDGDMVETRPIKGTAKRSPDPVEDRALAEALLASEKDRAENVMIVDLLRNDISRVCTASSVEVPVLCGLESYASVHHLVSVVTGQLRPGTTAGDLIGATFPGGSITGAPKIRAMDIITEIENTARGPYCGAIGYLGFDGAMDLNIAIRTVSFARGMARLSAGGGITVLSDPAAEYEETFTKATRVFAAFEADDTASAEDGPR